MISDQCVDLEALVLWWCDHRCECRLVFRESEPWRAVSLGILCVRLVACAGSLLYLVSVPSCVLNLRFGASFSASVFLEPRGATGSVPSSPTWIAF